MKKKTIIMCTMWQLIKVFLHTRVSPKNLKEIDYSVPIKNDLSKPSGAKSKLIDPGVLKLSGNQLFRLNMDYEKLLIGI